MWFLLLLALGSWHRTQGRGEQQVKVLSLQRGLWHRSNDATFARFNFSQLGIEPLPEFSVCYRVRLEAMEDLNIHLSYAVSPDNSNAIMIYTSENKLKAWYNRRIQSFTVLKPFECYPGTWYHLCHTFSATTYAIYVQGEEFTRGAILGDGGPLLVNGTLILGQEQDGVSQGFDSNQVLRGDIAQVSFWNRILAEYEVASLASCESLGRGGVFSSDTADLELFGDITHQWMSLDELCRSSPRYVMLPEDRSISDGQLQCHLSNGTLALPTSEEENEYLLSIVKPFEGLCAPTNVRKLWLGATDAEEEGVWRRDGDGAPMEYNKFYPPAPNGGVVGNCLVMRSDGAWEDDICDERNKKCTACFYRVSDYLRLRGLCFDNSHQRRFQVVGYLWGKLMYRGFYSLLIYRDPTNTWVLTDTKTNRTVATHAYGTPKHYPLGRRRWTLRQTTCDRPEGEEVELSLSPCHDDQYMCQSGECIDPSHRCNLMTDCLDGSDEEDCSFVLLPKGYRRHLTPIHPVTKAALPLTPHLDVYRFNAIDVIRMTVTIEFSLSLTWRDHRLTFRNLHEGSKKAIISKGDMDRIWIPDYEYKNIYSGELQQLENIVSVERLTNRSAPDYNAVDMDTLFPGSENPLTQTRVFFGTFGCDFALYYYPFDAQLCLIKVELDPDLKGQAVFTLAEGTASYRGPPNLPLFTVKDMRLSNVTDGASAFVSFVLDRRTGIAVLTTFVPCVLILLVSWATLFIRLEALDVRTSMSLTTLLVLYTFFSNHSSSLPATAEIKLIDLWFFFIIFLLFGNIVVHIVAEFLPRDGAPVLVKTKGAFLSPPSRLRALDANTLMRVQRYIVIPVLFIVFNIYFWFSAFTA